MEHNLNGLQTSKVTSGKTTPGIGPGNWDSAVLAQEQERKAESDKACQCWQYHVQPCIRPDCKRQSKDQSNAVLYRLYTEDIADDGNSGLELLVSRYFKGATIYATTGLWLGNRESGLVVEIIATAADLQAIVHLAGDIKVQNHQSSVLVTWAPVSRLDV